MISAQSESTSRSELDPSGDFEVLVTAVPIPPRSPASALNQFLRQTIDWMSPFRVWRELRLGQTARRDFAAGLALGVFIACIPIYGLQTILGLFAARRLNLHPLPVVAGSQLSAPPFAPALTLASIILGHSVIFRKLPHLADWHLSNLPKVSLAAFNSLLASWIIGGAILGIVLAALTFFTACAAMHLLFGGETPLSPSPCLPRATSRGTQGEGRGEGPSAI